MRQYLNFFLWLILPEVCAMPCQKDTSVTHLKFLDEYVVSFNQDFRNTTVGGLSGIDYDPVEDVYYLLSDDRSTINPARFYKARIRISNNKIDTIEFLEVNYLCQKNGNPYPDAKRSPLKTIDPEGIRFNPASRDLTWVSEGERIIRNGKYILSDPSINVSDTRGKFIRNISLPGILKMDSIESGPRQNGALEGLAFDRTGRKLFIALEEPLYQDGPQASLTKTNSWIRIFSFDIGSGKNTGQFAYALEPIAFPAVPENAFKMNGVSEILWIADNKLLIVERSFSMGRASSTVKVYVADLNGATNIMNVPSLKVKAPERVVSKRLLLDMNDLGFYVDNIEGVTFGPILPNGNKSIIFMADNNFNPLERSQFFLFEVTHE